MPHHQNVMPGRAFYGNERPRPFSLLFFFAVAVVIFFFWIFLWLSIQFRSPHSSVDIKTGIDLEEGSSAWFSAVSLFYYFFFKRNLTIFSSFHSAHLSRSSLR